MSGSCFVRALFGLGKELSLPRTACDSVVGTADAFGSTPDDIAVGIHFACVGLKPHLAR
jgi:hypothetical protein